MSYAKDGRLRALAVLLKERSPLLPEVPTIDEAGAPQVSVRQWAGVFGPPRMPREIVERLNAEVRKALASPDTRQRLVDLGGEPGASSPEEMKAFIEREIAKWREVIALRRIEKQ